MLLLNLCFVAGYIYERSQFLDDHVNEIVKVLKFKFHQNVSLADDV